VRSRGEASYRTAVLGLTLHDDDACRARSSVREEYMPAMRLALTAPMWGVSAGGREKDGIADVMQLMNDYSLTRYVACRQFAFCASPFVRRIPTGFVARPLAALGARRDDWEALLEMTKIKVRPERATRHEWHAFIHPDARRLRLALHQAEGVSASLRDPASLIPTAVKSAFTRECNKVRVQPPRALHAAARMSQTRATEWLPRLTPFAACRTPAPFAPASCSPTSRRASGKQRRAGTGVHHRPAH
jgi:hypothetical protein